MRNIQFINHKSEDDERVYYADSYHHDCTRTNNQGRDIRLSVSYYMVSVKDMSSPMTVWRTRVCSHKKLFEGTFQPSLSLQN